jgi:purine-nucleoside phosphorylase
MREVLHQFLLINNRVRVGIGEQLNDQSTHGVVLGMVHHSGDSLRVPFTVDQPDKLNHANNAMVLDMVDQIDKLGMQVEVIELHSAKTVYTYRSVEHGQVALVSKAPKHQYRPA